MSLYGAFDKTKHLEELNTPLPTNEGFKSPSARKSEARAALNIAASFTEHMNDAAFGEQPVIAQPTPIAQDSTGTLTAAQLLGGLITSTTAAAVSATLPLGTSLETSFLAAYPTLANLDSLKFSVINTGANAFTVLTNTGWTLSGSMVVAAGTSGRFQYRRTAANTYVLYRIG